jgi:antitoxin ParD1/3/4
MASESSEPLHVNLPASTREFAQEQAAAGGFANVSDYVASLVHNEQRHKAEAELEALLLEGINSGPATPMTREDWDAIRSEISQRLKAQQPGG